MQQTIKLNQWLIDTSTGEVWRIEQTQASESLAVAGQLDPKACELLRILLQTPEQLVEKEQIIASLWPEQVVSDDALTATVSRLRKVLQDDPRRPTLIQTLPKRGYRLLLKPEHYNLPASPSTTDLGKPKYSHISPWIILASAALIVAGGVWIWLSQPQEQFDETSQGIVEQRLNQADDYYLQMRRQDNEMAIELYQQAMALRPESGRGQAGLANALVQQVIRWSPSAGSGQPLHDLAQALNEQRTQTSEAKLKLARALALAKNAVSLAPQDPRSHKALGFVYSALGQFEQAKQSYSRAIELDDDAWDALINMGDILEISGQQIAAIGYFERAFAAMGRVYPQQSARIQPWHADLGALIGEKYQRLEQPQNAEIWFRKVLEFAPFNARATYGLVMLLRNSAAHQEANSLCRAYQQRIGVDVCTQNELANDGH